MASVRFEHRLHTPHSPDALWQAVRKAVEDTDAAPFWPHSLNRVRVEALEVGATIRATYRIPNAPDTRRRYHVSAVEDRGFSYSPDASHPFEGEITVRVEEHDGNGVLYWGGEYTMPWWRPERLFFSRFFEPRFFGGLRQGLQGPLT